MFRSIKRVFASGNEDALLLENLEDRTLLSGFDPPVNYNVGDITPVSSIILDVNNDSRADVVTAGWDSGTIKVRLGTDTGFTPVQSYPVGPLARNVTAGDFNRDGRPDIAAVLRDANSVSVILNQGGTFAPRILSATGGQTSWNLAAGDINRDGLLDVVTVNSGSGNVSVLLGLGTGAFRSAVTYAVGSGAAGIALADVNRDGILDVLTANLLPASNNVSLLIGNSDGTFRGATNFTAGNGPIAIQANDINNDGMLDLIVLNNRSGDVTVRLGNGIGGFGSSSHFGVGSGPQGLAIGDVDGDGKLDIVTANTFANSISFLKGLSAVTFAAKVDYPSGSGPISVVLGDINRDGRLDAVTANSNAGTFSVLFNQFSSSQTPTGNMTAHRPQTAGFHWDAAAHQVPNSQEVSPGVGIRINNDDDDRDGTRDRIDQSVPGEDDLIKLILHVTPLPGFEYSLKRNAPNICVWTDRTKDTPVLQGNDTRVLTFNSSTITNWVEYRGNAHGAANIELIARNTQTGVLTNLDTIRFLSFRSIIVAFGGNGQNPSDASDPNFDLNLGTFKIATDLYDRGYDVLMFREANAIAAYHQVANGVRDRKVLNVSIFGYSQGAGATYVLADKLNTTRSEVGTFTIQYTAYIDGIKHIGPTPEDRRPPATLYHHNFFQRNSDGSTTSGSFGLGGVFIAGATNVNVHNTVPSVNHFTVDDQDIVLVGIRSRLIERMPIV